MPCLRISSKSARRIFCATFGGARDVAAAGREQALDVAALKGVHDARLGWGPLDLGAGKAENGSQGPVPLIRRLTAELLGYLRNNADFLRNYGRRYRAGQRISSALVAVNHLIDKCMSKSL
jgi:hypothetical protein